MKKKIYLVLFLIFILGAVLRFYGLGKVPSGFHTDEAYFSYNAYSIFKTGREITGNLLPLNLKSFLYSPAGYSYLSIPFIGLFGLSEFSSRFASALFGSLIIPLVFFLVLRIFKNFLHKNELGLASSFLLAISPWCINLSRVCTENILVVFFITLGVYFFISWSSNNKWYLLLLSFLSFFLTLFLYQASRSFLPVFLPFLFIYEFYKKKCSNTKIITTLLLYIFLIIIPVVLILLSPQLSFRIKSLSIFQNPNTNLILFEQQREDGVMGIKPLESRFFHNKITNYASTFSQNYFKHFSFDFLFTDAGLPIRYRITGSGLLYTFELVFIILGILATFSFNKKIGLFILGWILIAPIGSALTSDDVPNLQRTLMVFPAISILSGMGLIFIIRFLKERVKIKNVRKFCYLILSLIIFYNFLTYLHAYYIHGPLHRSWYRDEGQKELIKQINLHSKNFKKVVITDSNAGPTIFLLFYNKYDPGLIQNLLKNDKSTNYGSMSFDKYEITSLKCPLKEDKVLDPLTGARKKVLTGKKGILYVIDGNCQIPSSGTSLITDIKRLDGTIIFRLVSLK